ncbi:hypothetical protein AAVH_18215, partial [Aphelenchoides avenae]
MDKVSTRETLSSLPLQVALHYNLYLAPFLIVCQIVCFVVKYDQLHPTYRVILTAVHLISVAVELVRPCLGYYGNLAENIPALNAFGIVSVIIQLPICLFLALNPDICPLPLERFAYLVQFIFLVVEVITVGFLIKRLAQHQRLRFKARMLEADDLEEEKKG